MQAATTSGGATGGNVSLTTPQPSSASTTSTTTEATTTEVRDWATRASIHPTASGCDFYTTHWFQQVNRRSRQRMPTPLVIFDNNDVILPVVLM